MSPAGLAAALDTVSSGEVQLGAGLTVEKVMQNISVTYSLTFTTYSQGDSNCCRDRSHSLW